MDIGNDRRGRMVIRGEDRVSTVLARDETLIDVFVSLSPAFERLRNMRMRKVMSRLVTVEQAARMAGVDAVDLVARLNKHVAGDSGGEAVTQSAGAASVANEAASVHGVEEAMPPLLARIPAAKRVELDVRAELRAGEEPFSRIMATLREVPDGGAFAVRAIFEPVPLYAVLGRQGLAHYTQQLGADDWRVWFYPDADTAVRAHASEGTAAAADAAGDHDADDAVVVLDVRGLEPPEPMLRTLAALESLPTGHTLVQLNVRAPQFLLPLLEERGFTYVVREQAPDLVRVFIRQRTADAVSAIT